LPKEPKSFGSPVFILEEKEIADKETQVMIYFGLLENRIKLRKVRRNLQGFSNRQNKIIEFIFKRSR